MQPSEQLERFVTTESGPIFHNGGGLLLPMNRVEYDLAVLRGSNDGDDAVRAVYEAGGIALVAWFLRDSLKPRVLGVAPVFPTPDERAKPARIAVASDGPSVDVDLEAFENGQEFVAISVDTDVRVSGYVRRRDLALITPQRTFERGNFDHRFTRPVDILSGPGAAEGVLGWGSDTTEVRLLSSSDGWAEVIAANDLGAIHGFVPADAVEPSADSVEAVPDARHAATPEGDIVEPSVGTPLYFEPEEPPVGLVSQRRKFIRDREYRVNGWTAIKVAGPWSIDRLWIKDSAP